MRVVCIGAARPNLTSRLHGLMSCSQLVMTDSGGVQEEATALGIPWITLRDNTERPITVTEGTNEVSADRLPTS
nr:UDP-N-acetylglucosamine 2-epimerase [Desertimonas flava]